MIWYESVEVRIRAPPPATPDPDGARTMKTVVFGVLVLFIGFWMVQAPDSLATFTRDGAGWLWEATSMVFGATIDFLGSLVG